MFAATTVPCCRDRQSCSRSYSGVLVPSGQTSLLAAAGRVLLPNPERRAERPQQSSHSLANRHRAVRDRAAPHIRRPRRAWEQALALPFPADGEVADRLQSRTPELRRRAPTAALSVGYSVADACPARDVPRSRPASVGQQVRSSARSAGAKLHLVAAIPASHQSATAR
jgi:hypothetical protein